MFSYIQDVRNSWVFRFYLNNPSCLYHHNKSFIWSMFSVIFLIFVIASSIMQVTWLKGSSMQPNRYTGDITMTNKMAYDFKYPFIGKVIFRVSTPKKGDIVAINAPQKVIIKRIVGLPGDKLKIENKIVFINDEPLNRVPFALSVKDEKGLGWSTGVNYSAFTEKNGPSEYNVLYAKSMHPEIKKFQIENLPEIKIPANKYFVLGDNRITSKDSRVIGLVSRQDIIGKTSEPILSLKSLIFWE